MVSGFSAAWNKGILCVLHVLWENPNLCQNSYKAIVKCLCFNSRVGKKYQPLEIDNCPTCEVLLCSALANISCTLHSASMEVVSHPWYRGEHGGPGRLRSLPWLTQRVAGRARIRTSVRLLPVLVFVTALSVMFLLLFYPTLFNGV